MYIFIGLIIGGLLIGVFISCIIEIPIKLNKIAKNIALHTDVMEKFITSRKPKEK